MLILFDENISHRIVEAIEAIGSIDGLKVQSSRSRDEIGDADVSWIEKFAKEGGRLFVSGDASMRSIQLERAALEASGLVAVFPQSPKWYNGLRRWKQAGYMIVWFPVIARLAQEAEPGSHWKLPDNFSAKFEDLIRLPSLAELDIRRERKAEIRSKMRGALKPGGIAD